MWWFSLSFSVTNMQVWLAVWMSVCDAQISAVSTLEEAGCDRLSTTSHISSEGVRMWTTSTPTSVRFDNTYASPVPVKIQWEHIDILIITSNIKYFFFNSYFFWFFYSYVSFLSRITNKTEGQLWGKQSNRILWRRCRHVTTLNLFQRVLQHLD